MNDAPEEAGGTTGIGRTSGRIRGNHLGRSGSVSSASSPERKGFSPEATRSNPEGTDSEAAVLRFVVDAHVCGALGCRSGGPLFAVEGDLPDRVLCDHHVEEYLGQLGKHSKRPATLRCARSAEAEPSAAGRALPTEGRETRGGAGCGLSEAKNGSESDGGAP